MRKNIKNIKIKKVSKKVSKKVRKKFEEVDRLYFDDFALSGYRLLS
jgi:hypothetical protein